MPTCKVCEQDLPVEKFGKNYYKTVNGEKKYSIPKTCMVCYRQRWLESDPKNRETHRKGSSSWYHRNPDQAKTQRLRRYGMDVHSYNDMRKKQDYRCAICKLHETEMILGRAKSSETALHVDHCHETGEVRALLCTNCNIGIGKLQENPEIIMAALEYVNSFKRKEA